MNLLVGSEEKAEQNLCKLVILCMLQKYPRARKVLNLVGENEIVFCLSLLHLGV